MNFVLVFFFAVSGADSAFTSSRCPCASSDELAPLSPDVVDDLDVDNDTYGIGCEAHDQNRSVCVQQTKECLTLVPVPKWCIDDLSWCPLKWCYIKSLMNCSLPHSQGHDSRFFSYATCGYRDRFNAESQPYSLRGHVLSITYRQPSSGWKGAFNPGSDGGNVIDDKWYGPMVDLLSAAADDSVFLLNTTDAPLDVYNEAGGHRNQRCVYAAGLGYVDICVALLPMKDTYVSLAPFFSVLAEDVYMVSPLIETSVFDEIWGFLNPFHTHLWLAIVGFVGVLSLMFMWEEFYEDSEFAKLGKCVDSLNSLYLGFAGFFSGSSLYEPLSVGGKMINIAFNFFALLIISAYTANLAAELVVSTSGPKFSSLQYVLNNGYRICGTSTTIGSLATMHPSAVTYKLTRKDLLKGIDDGLCDVAMMYQEDLQVAHGSGVHCNKVSVGLRIFNIHKGLAINPLKAHAISWHLQKQINSAKMAQILRDAQPSNQCSAQVLDDSGQFTVLDMMGAFIISATLAITGIVINFIHKRLQKQPGEDTEGNAGSTDPPVKGHVDELRLANQRSERKVQDSEAQTESREYAERPCTQSEELPHGDELRLANQRSERKVQPTEAHTESREYAERPCAQSEELPQQLHDTLNKIMRKH